MLSTARYRLPARRPCPAPAPPAWVDRLLGPHEGAHTLADFACGVAATARHGRSYSLVTARVDHARVRDDLDLQRAVVRAYDLLRVTLAGTSAGGGVPVAGPPAAGPPAPRVPLRVWNFVPGIVNATGGGLDRYMVFNAGRFAAFADWFRRHRGEETGTGPGAGPPPRLDRDELFRRIPTATGVGHAGDDLIVHLLAGDRPGLPVENPRQRAAYRYSSTYGPLPPCFARATRLPGTPGRLLIGGTASVCGEASVHAGDLRAQTAETFRNLDTLVRAAGGPDGAAAIDHLRVYYTHAHDHAAVRDAVAGPARRCRLTEPIEYVHAPLCRRDLDVEIEATATLD